eukprot:TRINITY_DN2461_c0_g1_i10.p16 TRINITY_DN2461_c0_g1~~TRINITY_DN2461_c0_g1_i10.p16  ORF type:complete len:101 (-),score=19.93 TRINITY_DN2461_c0_g1_i10:3733-4008(-)
MSGEEDMKNVSPQMQQFLAQEQQKAVIQQMIFKVTEDCFDKCIATPGKEMSGRERTCIENCAKRFVETTQFIMQRFQKEAGGASGGTLGGF